MIIGVTRHRLTYSTETDQPTLNIKKDKKILVYIKNVFYICNNKGSKATFKFLKSFLKKVTKKLAGN